MRSEHSPERATSGKSCVRASSDLPLTSSPVAHASCLPALGDRPVRQSGQGPGPEPPGASARRARTTRRTRPRTPCSVLTSGSTGSASHSSGSASSTDREPVIAPANTGWISWEQNPARLPPGSGMQTTATASASGCRHLGRPPPGAPALARAGRRRFRRRRRDDRATEGRRRGDGVVTTTRHGEQGQIELALRHPGEQARQRIRQHVDLDARAAQLPLHHAGRGEQRRVARRRTQRDA